MYDLIQYLYECIQFYHYHSKSNKNFKVKKDFKIYFILLFILLLDFLYFAEIIYLFLCFFEVLLIKPCDLQLALCENPIFFNGVVKQYFLVIGIFYLKNFFFIRIKDK
jgi:hypothetical protein